MQTNIVHEKESNDYKIPSIFTHRFQYPSFVLLGRKTDIYGYPIFTKNTPLTLLICLSFCHILLLIYIIESHLRDSLIRTEEAMSLDPYQTYCNLFLYVRIPPERLLLLIDHELIKIILNKFIRCDSIFFIRSR